MNGKEFSLWTKSIIFCLITALFFTTCSNEDCYVNIKTKAAEPHIAWNGENFAVVYYAGQVINYPLNLSMALLDVNGNLIKEIKIPEIKPNYKFPGRLTELIWNEKEQHFAFAYANGDKIWFFRYDSSLNIIDKPYALINEPGNLLIDIAIAYNSHDYEYGITFISRTKSPTDRQNVYFAAINSKTGYPKKVNKQTQSILIKGKGILGAEKTSLCYDTDSKRYALAYYNDKKAFVRFFTEPKLGPGFPIRANNSSPESIKIVPNAENSSFLILQLDKTGNLSGNIVTKTSRVDKPFHWPNKVDRKICVTPLWYDNNYKFLVSVSERDLIKSYMVNGSGELDKNITVPKASKYSYEPTIATVNNEAFVVWVQDKDLFFQKIRI